MASGHSGSGGGAKAKPDISAVARDCAAGNPMPCTRMTSSHCSMASRQPGWRECTASDAHEALCSCGSHYAAANNSGELGGSRCRRICVCSEDSARTTINQGLTSQQVRTLWNGIDLDRFEYRGPNIDGPAITVSRI